jgi:hypothetical protein
MKKLSGLILALSMSAAACSYAPGGVSADGKVVLAKNVGFLFGIMNKVFVCNVTPGGLAGCTAGETP